MNVSREDLKRGGVTVEGTWETWGSTDERHEVVREMRSIWGRHGDDEDGIVD
jgi:hypothetical protein